MKRIQLRQGYITFVDDADYEYLNSFSWKPLKTGNMVYATRSVVDENGKHGTLLMHRVITNAPPHLHVDHNDGNSLNNQRHNLRFATPRQNGANVYRPTGVSKYKGVYWNKKVGRWQAQISGGYTAEGKKITIYLGLHDSEEDAARAYDFGARTVYGDFARLNFPNEVPKMRTDTPLGNNIWRRLNAVIATA